LWPLRWYCCQCCCNDKDQRNGRKRAVRHIEELYETKDEKTAWFTEDDDHEPSEDNNHDDRFPFHFGTLDNIDDLEHEGDTVWRMEDLETGSGHDNVDVAADDLARSGGSRIYTGAGNDYVLAAEDNGARVYGGPGKDKLISRSESHNYMFGDDGNNVGIPIGAHRPR
jgi:hypothetical protein